MRIQFKKFRVTCAAASEITDAANEICAQFAGMEAYAAKIEANIDGSSSSTVGPPNGVEKAISEPPNIRNFLKFPRIIRYVNGSRKFWFMPSHA